MKQVFLDSAGNILVEEVPEPSPDLSPGFVRVKVSYSLISAGTDRSLIAGSGSGSLLKKVGRNPTLLKKLYGLYSRQGLQATKNALLDKLHNRIPLGYSCAGIVTACGPSTTGVRIGDSVACAGVGFANHAEVVVVPRNLIASVPDTLSLEEACFVALGSIAQQGIRQAGVTLGERVLVIGLGLLGQLAVQLLQLTGAYVAGIDLEDSKVDKARASGADLAVVLSEQAERQLRSVTQGHGYDSVIVTAANTSGAAFEMATHLVRDRGTIALIGVVGMPEGATSIIGKEVTIKGSRSYGPGRYDSRYEERGLDYPYAYVRWTEARNMQFFIDAAAQGRLKLFELISHRFDVSDAIQAYQKTVDGNADTFGVVLSYPEKLPAPTVSPYSLIWKRNAIGVKTKRRVAVWGLGGFAREAHLPNITAHRDIELVAVGSHDGANAAQIARRYNVAKAVTDFDAMLKEGLDGIIICGKHFTHAKQAIAALESGISVLVEKPIGISPRELNQVSNAYQRSTGGLMAGHNRKYSAGIAILHERLLRRTQPVHISYRIAAGPMPESHWMLDPSIGGGRLVSELSHFIDVCLHLTGQPVSVVDAHYTMPDRTGVFASLVFQDSSTAVVTYLPQGDKAIGKEYLEIHNAGDSFRFDNYIKLTKSADTTIGKWKGGNKGYSEEVDAFVNLMDSPRSDQSIAITKQDLLATQIMFDIIDCANKSR